jgi:hypothetical protein
MDTLNAIESAMRKSVLTSALSACLFLLIVAAKWATFDRYGSPMPDWDQWDAEAVELFIPWFDGDNFLSHLFHPHNEHRIVLTKLQNLALLLLNGQWDSRLEAVTNAMLHAALAVALWVCARRWVAARWHALLFVVIAALFGLPLAWQNILGGFHSQQYWLLALSFVAIVSLPYSRVWSAAWCLGVMSALLVLGSMGSGLLAAAIVLLVVVWRAATREISLRSAWPTLFFAAAILAFGLATRVEVAWHQEMKARTVHDFFFSTIHSLQWPLSGANWAAAVLWLPWLLVVWHVLASRWRGLAPGRSVGPADSYPPGAPPEAASGQVASLRIRGGQTIAALGGWVLVQVLATAYARGAGADYPASRYMDTLAFGTAVNAVAIAWLLTLAVSSWPARYAGYALGLGWMITLSLGLREVSQRNFGYELPEAKKYYFHAEANMRRYLATNDRHHLDSPAIPFPSADGLVERLAHPKLRSLMPVPIRASLPMTKSRSADCTGFIENNAVGAVWATAPRLGLSPPTPPLDDVATWGSFRPTGDGKDAKGTWQSAPLTAGLGGWLKFETAGDPGPRATGVRLTLHDAKTGELLGEVAPSRRAGDGWRAAYVRAPRVPFVIRAEDTSATEWIAFSPPVEMAPLSYWAWQANRHGRLLLYCTAGATVALALLAWQVTRRQSTRSRS